MHTLDADILLGVLCAATVLLEALRAAGAPARAPHGPSCTIYLQQADPVTMDLCLLSPQLHMDMDMVYAHLSLIALFLHCTFGGSLTRGSPARVRAACTPAYTLAAHPPSCLRTAGLSQVLVLLGPWAMLLLARDPGAPHEQRLLALQDSSRVAGAPRHSW